MANINLLPWREELRQERNRQFYSITGLIGFLGLCVVLLWYISVDNKIVDQETRNKFIKNKIVELDEKITEIKELKARKAELIERMNIIQELQGNRPVIVRLFDELVRTLPDGVYYTSLSKEGPNYKIEGVAENNNRVSSLMRNFEESRWFVNPNLSNVVSRDEQNRDGETQSVKRFTLSVKQAKIKSAVDEETGG